VSGWLIERWQNLLFGNLVFGVVFGLFGLFIQKFWLRIAVGGGLCLSVYFWMVNAVGHAGFHWSNELASQLMLGVLLGCCVRPAVLWILGFVYKDANSAGPKS
jgi:hypothetical protein